MRIKMKVLTHEEWMKNPTPRIMLVWDDYDDYDSIGKMKVVYVSKPDIRYPVIALADNDLDICRYKHCAEIEEPRRMTHKELAHWLRKKPTREFRYSSSRSVYSTHTYDENYEEEIEVPEDILIREDDGEWREPLVEE